MAQPPSATAVMLPDHRSPCSSAGFTCVAGTRWAQHQRPPCALSEPVPCPPQRWPPDRLVICLLACPAGLACVQTRGSHLDALEEGAQVLDEPVAHALQGGPAGLLQLGPQPPLREEGDPVAHPPIRLRGPPCRAGPGQRAGVPCGLPWGPRGRTCRTASWPAQLCMQRSWGCRRVEGHSGGPHGGRLQPPAVRGLCVAFSTGALWCKRSSCRCLLSSCVAQIAGGTDPIPGRKTCC